MKLTQTFLNSRYHSVYIIEFSCLASWLTVTALLSEPLVFFTVCYHLKLFYVYYLANFKLFTSSVSYRVDISCDNFLLNLHQVKENYVYCSSNISEELLRLLLRLLLLLCCCFFCSVFPVTSSGAYT